MKNKRIVFWGGIGNSYEFGGEPSKNKEIIIKIKEYGYELIQIDTLNCRRNKAKLLNVFLTLFFNILFHPKSTFIFSTSFGNIYPLVKLFHFYPLRMKMIFWVIGGSFADQVLRGEYEAKFLDIFNLFIVEGVKMKNTMKHLGFHNVIVKPNFKTIKSSFNVEKLNDGKIHFYFLSRIEPTKGIDIIFDSIKILNDRGYESKYTVDFYGNCSIEYAQNFRKKIERYPNSKYCGRIQLLDWKNYKILSKYHYMLFPTFWKGEGFPGVVMDAYISGTPIIASDWSLNTEYVINGKTGYIMNSLDAKSLSNLMLELINNKDGYNEMVHNCKIEALKYDTSNVITKDFFIKIL